MPFNKVYIHFVWATKNRQQLINKDLKPVLLKHIKENSAKKGISIDCMNCVSDHIHILILLGREQTIANTAMLIKGDSSLWVNKEKIIRNKFEWQDEYIAMSVNHNALKTMRGYIANQEEHHHKNSFVDEYKNYIAEESK
jgi:putative transposase